MAYYAWDSAHEPVEPVTPAPGSTVSGLGAYYAWDSSHEPVVPVSGLGADSEEAKVADEALRARIDSRPPVDVVGEWAIQKTDNQWADTPKSAALTLLPLTDQDLNQARHAAFGLETRVVGVLHKTPKRPADQALAFAGTPYEPSIALAVYSLTDTRRVALPYFLTLATLRDIADEDRGSHSVERAARALGGTLVYVVSLPATQNQRRPGARFQEVFNQIGLSAAEPSTPAPAALPEQSSLNLVPWFLGGTLIAGGIWWALARRA
jgi:hypothetical protein